MSVRPDGRGGVASLAFRAAPLLLAAILPAAAFAQPAEEPVGTRDDPALVKLSPAELIARLQDESKQTLGTHATAWASGFLAVDEEPRFRGGILGSARPARSATLRELVRRGTAALPDLLRHLDDPRPTKLVIEHGGMIGALWYSDEYDPRHGDPKKQPGKVNTGMGDGTGKDTHVEDQRYTIRVGDLCYVALGQIVNRDLKAVRYQPTACVVINSPVQTPTLAAATRADWAGLTPEEHAGSLAQDAYDKSPYAASSAVRRLLFYYPAAGEKVAVRLLSRPLYDDAAVWDFTELLAREKDAARWGPLAAEFRRTHGDPAADAVPFRLWWTYLAADSDRLDPPDRARVERIMGRLYSEYDPYRPPFINGAAAGEMAELVEGLAGVRSAAIDRVVGGVFGVVARDDAGAKHDRDGRDELAIACVARLAGGGRDAELRAFVAARVRALEDLPEGEVNRQTLEDFRRWTKRLEESR